MEFTTGLMSLDTALNDKPCHPTDRLVETCHWYRFWSYSGERCRFRRLMFRGLITPHGRLRGAFSRYVASGNRCPLPVNPLPVSHTMVNGLRVPAFVL